MTPNKQDLCLKVVMALKVKALKTVGIITTNNPDVMIKRYFNGVEQFRANSFGLS